MSAPDESTPLLGGESSSDQSLPKIYSTKNKKWHIIAFVVLLIILAIAGAATVWILPGSKHDSTSPVSQNENVEILLDNSWPRPDPQIQDLPFTSLIYNDVDQAVGAGIKDLEEKETIENDIEPISTDSPSYKHQHAIVNTPRGYNLSRLGYVENQATRYLKAKGYEQVIRYGSAKDLKWASESDCIKLNSTNTCSLSKYRTINGSCNNLQYPQTWGVAMNPFRRSLPANYSDGVSDPRGGFETELPSARDVSTMVHRPVHREDNHFSVMLAVWGQFIDHDITATALTRGKNGSTISCCDTKIKHPECFPVMLNKTDEYYSKYNISCMEFVRSAPALRCSFGPREQLNQASSYLDGSMIYGNTQELSEQLRSYQLGKLEVTYTSDGRALLPVSKDPTDGCNQAEEIKKGRYCFLSGDSRANENTHLTSIHLIFVRQHNFVAEQLAGVNPHWNDEILYQEARRIIIAQIQHITYNEFLPLIIGSDMMTKLELSSETIGYWSRYNSSIDATIANNFASASFRFAHTLIPRLMKLVANDTSSPEYVEMHKMLFNPFGLYKGDLDAIIRGALNTGVEKADNYFNTQLTEHLFESNPKPNKTHSFGLDLVALNIQRGRDHGLPTYPYWREYCGFARVTTFEDLQNVFDGESLKIISSIYKSVEEIDLYTGALSEYPIENGLLGPTFTCLIADQFFRLKFGDRFWYETDKKPQAFSEEQLTEIRKTSLAGILCENSDNLENVTPCVMKSASEENNRTACHNISQFDWSKFKDNPSNKSHYSRTNRLNLERADSQIIFDSNNYTVQKRMGSRINPAGKGHPIFGNKIPTKEANNEMIKTEQSSPSKNKTTQFEYNQSLEDKLKSLNDEASTELANQQNFSNIHSNLTKGREISHSISNEKNTKEDRNQVTDAKSRHNPPVSSPSQIFDNEEIKEIRNTTEAEKYFPEIFRIRSLVNPTEKNIGHPKISNTTLAAKHVTVNNGTSYSIIPPIEVSKDQYNNTLFTWRWSPETKTIHGNFTNVKENGTFNLEYKTMEGAALHPDCVYYSKISPSPDFELNTPGEPDMCSKIVPVIFNETSWNGNITFSVHDSQNDLEKENELSLNSDYNKITLKDIRGYIIMSIDGEDVLLWNNTLPAVFEPKMSFIEKPDIAAYPVSWSGFDRAGLFVGSFMLAEKQEDSVVWHEGRFSLNLTEYKDLIEPIHVQTAIVYLTDKEDVILDITEIEEIADLDLYQHSRLIVKGFYSKGKFHWNGELILIYPKSIPEENKEISYRPYTRYAGEILGGTLYAELNGPKYLWWSGPLSATVLIPVHIPRGYKQIFDQVLLWTFVSRNASIGHAIFVTYCNDSRISLSGDFDFKITSILNSPDFSPNTTYYSPIVLQQSINDFNDDVADLLVNKDVPGTLAPITLLGKYLRKEGLFAWNGKFVISIVENNV